MLKADISASGMMQETASQLLDLTEQLAGRPMYTLICAPDGTILAASQQAVSFFSTPLLQQPIHLIFEKFFDFDISITLQKLSRKPQISKLLFGTHLPENQALWLLAGRRLHQNGQHLLLFHFHPFGSGQISFEDACYHTLFQSSPEAIFILDKKGVLLEINESACRLSGFQKKELIGNSVYDLLALNEEETTYFNELLRRAKGQQPQRFQWKLRSKHQEQPVEIMLCAGNFLDEKVIIGFVHDITEQLDSIRSIRFRNLQLEFINYLLTNLPGFNSTDEILRFTLEQLIRKSDFVGGGIYMFNQRKNSIDLKETLGEHNSKLSKHPVLELTDDQVRQLSGENRKAAVQEISRQLTASLQSERLVVIPILTYRKFVAFITLFTDSPAKLNPSLFSLINFIGECVGDYLTKYELREELSTTELKYKSLFEGASDAIFLCLENDIVDCNERASAIFNCPKEKLLGPVLALLSPEVQKDGRNSLEKARELIRKTLATGKITNMEWVNKRFGTGELFESEISMSRIAFEGRYYAQVIVRDITERKQAEEAIRREEILRESIKHFRSFIDKVNLCSISIDQNGRIIYVNDYFLQFTGYSREEVLKRNYFDMFAPATERAKRKEDFKKLLESKALNSYYERDLLTKSGQIKTIRWNSAFEIDAAGKIVGLSSVGKDMTDKRIAMEALKDNKIRLQDLFDNAHDLIQNISVDNKFIFVNKAWKEKLGYNDHDIEKLTLNDIVHPYYKAKLIYQLRNLYKGEKVNKIETVFLTKSGKPIHLIGSINCSWQNDKPVATRAILHDITDRIKAERLQKVYYSIANLAISSKDLNSLYAAIHRELSKIIETRNIFIALTDENRQKLNFVYYIDQNNTLSSHRQELVRPFSKGISEYTIKTGKPIFLLRNDYLDLIEKGKVVLHGTLPEVMLCSPLSVGDKIIGVIAVQDYKKADAYISTDIEILHFISNQVALAIERKRNEEQINKQNARLKAIFESGSHFMWSVNRKSELTSFNQNFINTFFNRNGLVPESGAVFDRRNLKFMGRNFYAFWREKYRLAFQGKAQHFELQIPDEHGNETWREVFLNPIYLQDGTFEEVSAIAHDITEKKKSQLALSESEEKFRSIFESFQDLFYRTDAEGYLVLTSPSMQDILGYSPEEVIGWHGSTFYLDPEERITLMEKLFEQEHVLNFEATLVCKDGSHKQMLFNTRLIRDKNGKYIGVEGVGRDISELKKTQLELIRAKELAENLLQVKTQFLANMSHELRTPMNGIIGMIDLLYLTITSEEQREYIDTLRKSSDALLTILNDILDLSKIQAGKLTINETTVDLQYSLSKIHSLFANRAMQKNLEFEYFISEQTPRYIVTDETRMLQILSNLTSNAIKFTNSGSVTILVDTVKRKGKECILRFRVQDTGIGITEEDKTLLFTNFTQLDNSSTKSFGGTGLGLAISRELAELLGGETGVDSVYGEGSTFWFTITCRAADNTKAANELQAIQEAAPEIEQFEKAPYILLVDDNQINQKVATKLLEKIGCHTDVASNGFEAIDLAVKHRYHVIFMDIQMPEMDGVTAMHEIRKRLVDDCPPIIAMTAYSMENDAQKFISEGMDDYISKPVKSGDLYNIIRKWEKSNWFESTSAKKEAPQLQTVPGQQVIDGNIIQQLREIGGAEFTEQLYKDFEKEAGELLHESKKEVAAKHYKGILSKLHQIKGTGFTLGLNPLAETAKQLEHDILIDQVEHVEQNFQKLLDYYEQYKSIYKDIITQN